MSGIRGHHGPTWKLYESETTGCRRDGRKSGAPSHREVDMLANGSYQYYLSVWSGVPGAFGKAQAPTSLPLYVSLYLALNPPPSFAYCTCTSAQRPSNALRR
jgi:hypothetical protein